MSAAATAWDTLALELSLIAARYASVITELTGGQWFGPSSLSMATAAMPYVAWLHHTAQRAEETAAQAKEAAAAYELAFAMTVPPPVIAANRSLLLTLIATNFFGQNAPAIATTEAQYAEMWVQDAVAMYGYAESSATARMLTPFRSPGSTTDAAGLTAQSAATAHAVNDSAIQPITLPQLAPATPTTAAQLVAPAAASDPLVTPQALITIGLTPPRFVNMAVGYSSAATSGRAITIANARLAFQAARNAGPPTEASGMPSPARPGVSVVSAGLGRASPIGSLSIPPNWTIAAPEVRQVALALPDDGSVATASAAADMPQVPGNSFSQALLGTLSREEGVEARRQKNRPIIVRSPAAG